MKFSKHILSAAAAASIAGAAHAGVVNIDFSTEDDLLTPLANGQIIDTEFGNLFNLSSSGPNSGLAIFDTTTGVNSADPDLWVDSGNALILQESNNDANDGSFFTNPDDDTNGGSIFFDFLSPIQLISLDLIDINGNGLAIVTLTDIDGLTRIYNVPEEWTGDPATGDPGIGTLDLTILTDQPGHEATATASEDAGFNPNAVIQMEVFHAGSGAIDNLSLIVPAPSAALLLVGGLFGTRRRRRD